MIQKEAIKTYLLQVLESAQLVSGGNEIACPCPFCGDKRPKFYIGPFNEPNKPVDYNCFLCKKHGRVDQEFLDELNISKAIDPDIIKSNKGNGYKMGFGSNRASFNLKYDYVTVNKLTEVKLRYVNERLGVHFTYQDCINNKIILNLKDILDLDFNRIESYTRHPIVVDQLNTYFIGFLSRTNASLNMRNIIAGDYSEANLNESLQQRYINYKIFNRTVDNDFFILPCNLDLSRHVRLYIAEGPFDILGIKYNLIKSEDNCVYIAGKGKAYEQALFWFVNKFVPFSMEVHFFPDKDVEDKMITSVLKNYTAFGYKFYLHRNTYGKEKDFGVPSWRINDFCYKLG